MTTYNVALFHHGIKGQRWGVRRFQNKDGSLTDAGRKRYQDPYVESTREVVDSIAASLPRNQQKALGIKKGMTYHESMAAQGTNIVKRFMLTKGNEPVAFLDYTNTDRSKQSVKDRLTDRQLKFYDKQGRSVGQNLANKGGLEAASVRDIGKERVILIKSGVEWLQNHPEAYDFEDYKRKRLAKGNIDNLHKLATDS